MASANDGSGKSAWCNVIVSSPCPYGAVDLGLTTSKGNKLYWATSNLCKSGLCPKSSDYGDYYAWGETNPKSNYAWSNLKYCTDSSGDHFSKYVPYDTSSYWSGSGNPDNKITLDLQDDAAHVKLGGSWRMPTGDEWEELINKCKWTWTGKGYRVTGPNGNSIFLPAAGYRRGKDLYGIGSRGCYWSSSLTPHSSSHAYDLSFFSDQFLRVYNRRNSGLSIRPVSE